MFGSLTFGLSGGERIRERSFFRFFPSSPPGIPGTPHSFPLPCRRSPRWTMWRGMRGAMRTMASAAPGSLLKSVWYPWNTQAVRGPTSAIMICEPAAGSPYVCMALFASSFLPRLPVTGCPFCMGDRYDQNALVECGVDDPVRKSSEHTPPHVAAHSRPC